MILELFLGIFAIIYFTYALYTLIMDSEIADFKNLFLTFLPSLVLAYPFSFLLYFIYCFLMNIKTDSFWLHLSFYFGSLVIVWFIVYYLYKKFYHKDKKFPMVMLNFFIGMMILAFSVHVSVLRPNIERENIEYLEDIGEMYIGEPILENGWYSREVNFSFYNGYDLALKLFELDIKFDVWNGTYKIIDFFPKEDLINKYDVSNEIYYRWKKLEVGDTGYIHFSIIWSEYDGGEDYIPIIMSDDETFIRVVNTVYVKWITLP